MKVARALVLPVLATALALPTAASAAGPQHMNYSGTALNVALCGIATTLTFRGVDNFWPSFHAAGTILAVKEIHQERDVYTAANGKSIEEHFAGQQTATATVNSDGTFTMVQTYKGLPEQVSTLHGPVLSRDAGIITFVDQFDAAGHFIAQTIAVDKGPHPDGDSAGAVFCQIVTATLS
jgi:hypothetical protein